MRLAIALPFLLLLASQAGCKLLLYPGALAFGSPTEGELRKCRVAFQRLQHEWPKARLVVLHACDPTGTTPGWDAETGATMAMLLRERLQAQATASALAPSVPPAPYRGNQLRYLWSRAGAYGEWVRRTRPEGDFFCFVEITARPDGTALGLQLYILDGTGQVAFVRLMNSHHFGPQAPQGTRAACELLVTALQQGLRRKPEENFPPYGVG